MPKRNIIWLILIFCTAFVTVLVTKWYESRKPKAVLPRDERIQRVYDIIASNYYHDVPQNIFHSSAIEAMIGSLDEYSSFIPPEKCEEFRKQIKGRVFGSGLIRMVLSGCRLTPLPILRL